MLGRCALQRLGRIAARRPRTTTLLLHQLRGPRDSTRQTTRTLFTESIPPILVPPAIFTGLLLTLWTWKCFWIVVLQDKLLYLSWLPPFSRSETLASYEGECRPVQWTQRRIRSLDGTKLSLCEGRVGVARNTRVAADAFQKNVKNSEKRREKKKKEVVICYFQGNGGSTPMRLPLLSQVLRTIKDMARPVDVEVEYTVVALSYRGYWTSSGGATQRGIEMDAQALLDWVSRGYASPDRELQVVLWGHSLGAAVACTAALGYLSRHRVGSLPGDGDGDGESGTAVRITGLILEAPISSIKDMLVSLYPQKWLPYRYLWPFSWNNWDVSRVLGQMAELKGSRDLIPPIFLMSAKEDEVIPPWVADQIEQRAMSLGLDIERKDVAGAMHIEGPLKEDGRKAMVKFILRTTSVYKLSPA